MTEHFTELAIAALTLNVLAMAVLVRDRAARAARQSASRRRSRWSSASTTARWRSPSRSLINDDLAIPAAIYSAFMFLTAGAFARLMYQRNTPRRRGAGGGGRVKRAVPLRRRAAG